MATYPYVKHSLKKLIKTLHRYYFYTLLVVMSIAMIPCAQANNFKYGHNACYWYNCESIDFNTPFQKEWDNAYLKTWQLSIPIVLPKLQNNFNPIKKNNVILSLGDSTHYLKISRNLAQFLDKNDQEIFSFIIPEQANFSHVLLESNGFDRYQLQILLTTRTNNYVDSTPLIIWPDVSHKTIPKINLFYAPSNTLTINNMTAIVGNIDITKNRIKRSPAGILCWSIPNLQLFDMLVHGHCASKIEHFFSGTKELLSSSKKGYVSISNSNPLKSQPLPYPIDNKIATLKTIYQATEQKPFLSAISAARTCFFNLSSVMSDRRNRGNETRNDCLYSTVDIISAYTRAFGASPANWNQHHFNRIVDNILRTGATGIAHLNPNDEQALIAGVQLQSTIAAQMKREYIIRLRGGETSHTNSSSWLSELAFANAQAAYAEYSAIATAQSSATPSASLISPAQLQHTGAHGLYEISVPTYAREWHEPVLPRIYTGRGSGWQQDVGNEFGIITYRLSELQDVARSRLTTLIQEWEQTYRAAEARYGQYIASDNMRLRAVAQAIEASRLVTTSLTSRLAGRGSSQTISQYEDSFRFVLTHYNNRLVNILLVSVAPHQTGEEQIWSIDAALSDPNSVIPQSASDPEVYITGSVRGAGQAALHQVLQEASFNNIDTVNAYVISTPSALMFSRVGFQLLVELFDTTSFTN